MRSLTLPALCAITLTSASCTVFQKENPPEYDGAGQENAYGPYGAPTQPAYGSAAQPNPYAPAQADPYGAPANPYSQSNSYTQPPATNPYGQQPAASPYGSYETPQTYPAQTGGTYQQPYVQTDSTPSYSGGTSSGGGVTHTVVRGDTLSGLARKYKTTQSAIMQANGMTNDTVVLGKTLVIP